MDILIPSMSELVPAFISFIVIAAVIGVTIYVLLLLRRSVRALEHLAAASTDDGRPNDDAGSERHS